MGTLRTLAALALTPGVTLIVLVLVAWYLARRLLAWWIGGEKASERLRARYAHEVQAWRSGSRVG